MSERDVLHMCFVVLGGNGGLVMVAAVLVQ